MNNTIKIILLTGAGVALSLLLIGGGFLLGRSTDGFFQRPVAWQPHRIHFGRWDSSQCLSGYESRHSSRMRGFRYQEGLSGGEILTIKEAEEIIQEWLKDRSEEDLEIAEIMIFDNHAYGLIREKSTGMGAMEILVDPDTRAVYPEHGPNMMWNLKYSSMGPHHRAAWSGAASVPPQEIEKMPVTPEEAETAAQRFLDQYFPGKSADDHAVTFYGYYTLHILEDDHVVGMLSVNGYSGEVFFHSWHGELLDMSGH